MEKQTKQKFSLFVYILQLYLKFQVIISFISLAVFRFQGARASKEEGVGNVVLLDSEAA